ncbi:hypothetical protein QUA42_08090 [Microcoleus sp. Pol11C2]|uniref:hypothetical protein n=1 Tax=Microcoleus sp. Pol11C2 TaxID=3055389 RepID=UPI002FD77D4C
MGGADIDLIIHSGSKSSENKQLGYIKTVGTIDLRELSNIPQLSNITPALGSRLKATLKVSRRFSNRKVAGLLE